jgi:acyl carrier protein
VSCLSQHLGIPCEALDVHQPLLRYDLDSLVALELVADLEDRLGCSLPFTLAWDYPTTAAIARCVAARLYEAPCGQGL